MGMRRVLAVASCAVAVVALSAGSAFAGEITGNGKPTAIESGVANSLCAFNGLNDLNPEQGQTTSRVQTPKDGPFPGAAAFGFAPDPSDPGFILTCNPNGPVTANH
jgi:hypothetical protein